jgi:uncharacterized membrane protein YdbT with pleckstrin-like domain
MSYIDKHLIPNETIVYRGSLTRLPYAWAVIPLGATLAAAIWRNYLPASLHWPVPGALAAITVVVWLSMRLRVGSAEFVVTNRRVMIKLGIVSRRTVETMLSKVEGVTVEQTIAGRIFDYGTMTVTGTGGTRETFEHLAAPLKFRRQVQAQLARLDDERLAASQPRVDALR